MLIKRLPKFFSDFGSVHQTGFILLVQIVYDQCFGHSRRFGHRLTLSPLCLINFFHRQQEVG